MVITNESFYKPLYNNSVFKNYILDPGKKERLDAKKARTISKKIRNSINNYFIKKQKELEI